VKGTAGDDPTAGLDSPPAAAMGTSRPAALYPAPIKVHDLGGPATQQPYAGAARMDAREMFCHG